jgi:hypothetical protein
VVPFLFLQDRVQLELKLLLIQGTCSGAIDARYGSRWWVGPTWMLGTYIREDGWWWGFGCPVRCCYSGGLSIGEYDDIKISSSLTHSEAFVVRETAF